MTLNEAVKQNKKNLSININRIAELLIKKIDEVLVREIDGLLEGNPQNFTMNLFSKTHLKNNDNNMYVDNKIRIIEEIIRNYNIQGWEASKLKDTYVINIRIRKAKNE